MSLTLIIPVCLDVPVSVNVLGIVGLVTCDFNLLETPLRQVDIASAKIAAKNCVLQSKSSGQSSDLGLVTGTNITDDLHSPVIFLVTNSGVAITRNFSIGLGNWGSDLVRVKVTASLGVDQTQDIAVGDKLWWCLSVIFRLGTVWVEPPLVVGIFVMISGDLLLS